MSRASPPTIAELARAPGASFTFDCRLCGRHKFYYGDELDRFLARVPAGETMASLRDLRLGGVPRYIKLAILCWKVMTPEQRRRVERELDAEDKDQG